MTSGIGKRSAFTLVELCFVLTIIGLIVSISWPSLRSISTSIKAHADAAAFAQELQTSREHAVLAGVAQHVITPFSNDIQATANEAMFLPDGTARPLHVAFGLPGKPQVTVDLDETGHVLLTRIVK